MDTLHLSSCFKVFESPNPLRIVSSAPITTIITVTSMFHSLFFIQFSSKVEIFISFSAFFCFYSVVCQGGKVHNSARCLFVFVFFILFCWLSQDLAVWPRLGNTFAYKNPRKKMCLIVQDGFQAMHILLIRMVKFKFLPHIPIDHLLHTVVSSLILFELIFCIRFLYDRFVAITT